MINERKSDSFKTNLTKIIFFCTFKKNLSDSLIPSFLMSDLSESLRSLNENEQMNESLFFWSKSLIGSFATNKRFAQKTDE